MLTACSLNHMQQLGCQLQIYAIFLFWQKTFFNTAENHPPHSRVSRIGQPAVAGWPQPPYLLPTPLTLFNINTPHNSPKTTSSRHLNHTYTAPCKTTPPLNTSKPAPQAFPSPSPPVVLMYFLCISYVFLMF